jgi:RHS repeat-associated protein
MKPRFCCSRGAVTAAFSFFLLLWIAQGLRAGLGNDNPNGPSGEYNGSITTAGYMDPFTGNAKRVIDDITVPGSMGAYPLKWSRTLNTRGAFVADIFGQSGAWTHSYCWGLGIWQQLPPEYEPGPEGGIRYPDGRTVDLYDAGGGYYRPMRRALDQVHEVVLKTGGGNYGAGYYDLLLGDGGKVKFRPVNEIGLVPVEIVDPYGLTTTLSWAPSPQGQPGKLVRVTEPGGRYLQINYTTRTWTDVWNYVHTYHLIDNVEAYDRIGGTRIESVRYTYTERQVGSMYGPVTVYDLSRADYDDGTYATYTYQPANVTENVNAVAWRLVSTCDDMRYNGPMRQIKYEYVTGGVPGGGSWGQIRAERNKLTDEIISEITYPPANQQEYTPGYYRRTETRGDGQTRVFQYGDSLGAPPPPTPFGELTRYSDFLGNHTNISYSFPNGVTRKSVRDARDFTTHIDRNATGLISRITYPGNAYVEYAYHNTYYLETSRNERGFETSHIRDGNNRIIRTNYPNGAYETFTYSNNFSQVLTHRLKNGAYQHFQYDGRGLLLAKTNPTANGDWQSALNSPAKTTYTYYTAADGKPGWIDRIKTETLPANGSNQTASETYEYGKNAGGLPVPGRGLVTKITHADGKWQAFGYDDYGNKLWEENELRQRTTYTYDAYKRLLTTTNPLNKTTTSSYELTNGNQNLSATLHTTAFVHLTTTPTGIQTENRYDENFRKVKTIQAFGTGSAATTLFDYDQVGNLTWVTDPLNRRTRTQYDARNRKISSTAAYGTALATTTTWSYDSAGNVTVIGRPDGTQQWKTYDALNRVLTDTVQHRDGDPPVNLTTRFVYNPSGTIQEVKDAKWQRTVFAYDASDRKTKMTYHNGQSQSWAYDNAANLKSRTTVGGNRQDFAFDNRNRKVGMTWSNNAEWANFGYDYASRLTSAQNAKPVTGTISTISRQYDAAGRLTLDQQAVNGLASKSVNYEYDDDGKQRHMWVTPAPTPSYDYTFSYDAMGRFEKISPTGGAAAFQYYYDAASNETRRYNWINSVDQTYPRDSLNRLWRRDVISSGGLLSREVYTYDRMSRVTEVARSDGKRDLFGYYLDGEMYWAQYGVTGPDMPGEGGDPDQDMPDTTDPWSGWTGDPEAEGVPPPEDPGDPPPPAPPPLELPAARTVSYSYDRAGNRVGMNDDGNPIWYTTNLLNQYTGVTGSSLSNGNEHEISAHNGVNYYYRNDERLIRVTGPATYDLAYDALSRCVKRTRNNVTTFYIYDGEKAILEYNSAGAIVGRNLYGKGIDENLHRAYGGQTYYFQQDRNGNVTHLTSASGTIVEQYKYDAFGAVTVYDGSGNLRTGGTFYNNRFLFTGREYAATYAGTYTPAFNFYEYRARAYNPTLGRFMSEDPKLFDGGDYNLFRYCHNDPLDLTDPMGLDAVSYDDQFNYFVQSAALNRNSLKGSYINVMSPSGVRNQNLSQQCAKGAQFMAGTALKTGMHGVPKTHSDASGKPQWFQGPRVGPNTNGMMIARGFVDGVYPSLSPQNTPRGQIVNHVGIQTTFDKNSGVVTVFDQAKGKALGNTPHDARKEGWYVVLVPKTVGPYQKQGDVLVPTAQPPSGNTQTQMDAAQIENQQGAIPDFGMLGGGPLGLGGPPRNSGR